MFVLSMLLLLASVVVWFVMVIKLRQLSRWQRSEAALRRELRLFAGGQPNTVLAKHPGAFSAELIARVLENQPELDRVEVETDHIMSEKQRAAHGFMTLMASIATAAPLAGLFGTVYGIMEAFSKIGQEKSAALPVVAPAIGDALITTALGLFAAIPAVIAYNMLSRRIEDHLEDVRTFARAWLRAALSVGSSPRSSRGD